MISDLTGAPQPVVVSCFLLIRIPYHVGASSSGRAGRI